MDWRETAHGEIQSIKPHWVQRYGWSPSLRECGEHIDLYVHLNSCTLERTFVLRLRYEHDFELAGRREDFVDPDNLQVEGAQFWPAGVSGFNPGNNPRTICLEGTWGFHSLHHKERDPGAANLNKLLMEVQKCINR